MSDASAVEKSALNLLSRREHSRVELTQKLTQRGFAVSDITAVVNALVDKGYLSDERYVEMVVRSRQGRGYGPLWVRQELQHKGVVADWLDEYLEDHQEQWLQAAYQAYQKKYGSAPPTDTPEKLKRMQFLRYRGFTQNQIRQTIAHYELVENG